MSIQKYNNKEMVTRVLMTILGVLTAGIAVGFFSFSKMGLDPFQCFAHGTWNLFPLSYETWYVIINAVLLIVIFLVNKRMIGIGTLINLFLVGYAANASELILYKMASNIAISTRIISLIIGIVIMCFASAIYFTADLGVSTYDAIAITLSEKNKRIPFRIHRIITDTICVLIGWRLGATVGIGTIITAFFMGPLIDFFRFNIAEPLLKKCAGKA